MKNPPMEMINAEWTFGKIMYVFFWFFSLYHFLQIQNNIIHPTGIFKLIPFGFTFSYEWEIAFWAICFLSIVLYILETKMLLATALMSVTSIFAVSYQESNGIFHRDAHFPAIFTAQFFAYLYAYRFPTSHLFKNRLSFSIQIVVAIYFLAAISKIESSGLNWFLHPDNFLLQLYKNHFYLFADDTNSQHIIFATQFISFFTEHPWILKILLCVSLSLEFFCFLVLIRPNWKYPIAIGLLCMHIGIAYTMGIGMSSISMAVIAWMINPAYLIYTFKKFLFLPKASQN